MESAMVFGTSPVKNAYCKLANEPVPVLCESYDDAKKVWDAYWSLNASIDDFCDRRDHDISSQYDSTQPTRFLLSEEPQSPTMVFKRYSTLNDESIDDIVVNHLLKSLDSPKLIYQSPKDGIPTTVLNDDWVVNLRNKDEMGEDLITENEAYPMESFLTGLTQELKNQWKQEQQEPQVDLDNELKELLTVYDNTLKTLDERQESRLSSLVYEMERFCAGYKERREIRTKRATLKHKMGMVCNKECACGEEDGDDE